jgi:ATP-dependent helicase/nuclease subunit B
MLMEGAFAGLPRARRDAGAALRPHLGRPKAAQRAPARAAERARRGHTSRLVGRASGEARRPARALRGGEAAYLSRPYPKYARKFSDYDHLARVKEWSLASGDGDEEAAA